MKDLACVLAGPMLLACSLQALSSDPTRVAETVAPALPQTAIPVNAMPTLSNRLGGPQRGLQAMTTAPGVSAPGALSGTSVPRTPLPQRLDNAVSRLGHQLTPSGLIVSSPAADELPPLTSAIAEEVYSSLAQCSIRTSQDLALNFRLPASSRAALHAFDFVLGVTCPEGVRYQLATERGNGVQGNPDTLRASSYRVEIHDNSPGRPPEEGWVLLLQDKKLLAEGAHVGNGREQLHSITAVLLDNPFSTQAPKSPGELKPVGMTMLYALEQMDSQQLAGALKAHRRP